MINDFINFGRAFDGAVEGPQAWRTKEASTWIVGVIAVERATNFDISFIA
jgi:hypothetical protein